MSYQKSGSSALGNRIKNLQDVFERKEKNYLDLRLSELFLFAETDWNVIWSCFNVVEL